MLFDKVGATRRDVLMAAGASSIGAACSRAAEASVSPRLISDAAVNVIVVDLSNTTPVTYAGSAAFTFGTGSGYGCKERIKDLVIALGGNEYNATNIRTNVLRLENEEKYTPKGCCASCSNVNFFVRQKDFTDKSKNKPDLENAYVLVARMYKRLDKDKKIEFVPEEIWISKDGLTFSGRYAHLKHHVEAICDAVLP
jgi:hypothetical protein